MTVRASDGTQLSYVWMNNEYDCTQIKDRNGNYITIVLHSLRQNRYCGRHIRARSIKFNYDTNGLLTSITQIWNQGSHESGNAQLGCLHLTETHSFKPISQGWLCTVQQTIEHQNPYEGHTG